MEPTANRAHTQRLAQMLLCGLLCFVLLPTIDLKAQDTPKLGFASEANYLANIPKFVEWPAAAFPSDSAPLQVCIFAGKEFADSVQQLVKDERIHGRRVVIRLSPKPAELSNCHVLYLATLPQTPERAFLTRVEGKPVLTIGESANFLDQGGMIQFFFRDSLHMNVNFQAATPLGLKMDPALLSLASTVRGVQLVQGN